MTDKGLAALVELCPKLENLSLDGTCQSIFTYQDLQSITTNAKNLRFLDLLGCGYEADMDEFLREQIFLDRLDSATYGGKKSLFQFRLLPLE
jgi:hypothetical protein